MGFWQDFREFAVKGNALDMAVGIILGASFNKVVGSIVNDLIMPPVGMMLGGVDFKDLELILKATSVLAGGETAPAVALRYGMFIITVIEFLIVALSVFVVVKAMNRLIKQRQAK